MTSITTAPTAPTASDCHTIAAGAENWKNCCAKGIVNAPTAMAMQTATNAVFHGRNGRASTMRIQNADTSSEIVAAVEGSQQICACCCGTVPNDAPAH